MTELNRDNNSLSVGADLFLKLLKVEFQEETEKLKIGQHLRWKTEDVMIR